MWDEGFRSTLGCPYVRALLTGNLYLLAFAGNLSGFTFNPGGHLLHYPLLHKELPKNGKA